MNRRKLFGILAAAPAAAVAANTDNPNTVRIKLPPLVPGQKMVFRNYDATPLEFPKPKCYSVWDYYDIRSAFEKKYLKDKYSANCSSDVNSNICGAYDAVCTYNYKTGTADVARHTPPTQQSEISQAFADACLNGEVPGVWWE